jgi:hypothetical protein
MLSDAQNDFLEKGFQLASFLITDRPTALMIVADAANKVKAQGGQESKRHYWRDKYLKHRISKISRAEADTFQWLIYLESEKYEKKQEETGRVRAEFIARRYIKSLIRFTAARSSFHVNVGLHRILFNYSTSEAQRVYELMTSRFLGADEYRRAKLGVMRKLQARFGKTLQTVRERHGEIRFKAYDEQSVWLGLVEHCLELFTPWSTGNACLAPASLSPASDGFQRILSERGNRMAAEDLLETIRCHALIHPVCKESLLKALELSPSRERLAIPRFYLGTDSSGDSVAEDLSPPAPISEEERRSIEASLVSEDKRRRQFWPQSLRILVDGIEYVSCPVSANVEAQFNIPDGAELIEIWAEGRGNGFLLGTHVIRQVDGDGSGVASATIHLALKKKLVLTVAPATQASGEFRGWAVSLKCCEDSSLADWRGYWKQSASWVGSAPRLAAACAVILVIGVTATVLHYERMIRSERSTSERRKRELGAAENETAGLRRQLESQRVEGAIEAYRLIPDESAVRRGGSEFPTIVLPLRDGLINLEIPVADRTRQVYRVNLRPFSSKQIILTEDALESVDTPTGPVILFSLPSRLVHASVDYNIELYVLNSRRERELVDTFTIQVREK